MDFKPASGTGGFPRLHHTLAAVGLGLWLAMVPTESIGRPLGLLSFGTGMPSDSAAGESVEPVLSGDGRVAAFCSSAANLVTNDRNGALMDVFAIRPATNGPGVIELVSISTNRASGNGRSHSPAISADGRFVAFVSDASDLVSGDTNRASDVFVRDRSLGITLLVSGAAGGGRTSSGPSDSPTITPDGRFVAFESWAGDLVPGDTNGLPDVFVRDLIGGVTHWVSAPSAQPELQGEPSGISGAPRLSADGSRVVFASTARNLAVGPRGNRCPLYLHETRTGITRAIDLLPPTAAGWEIRTVGGFDLSADGRWVVVQVPMPEAFGPPGLYRYDLDHGLVESVAPDLNTFRLPTETHETPGPLLAADGRTVFFEARPLPRGTTSIPAVYSWTPGSPPVLLSTNESVADYPAQVRPVGKLLAANRSAEFVAFSAFAPAAHDARINGPLCLWVHHRISGEVRRIGTLGSDTSSYDACAVSFSNDGRRVVFDTDDPDLVPDDLNSAHDVFLYDWDSNRTELLSRVSEGLRSATYPGASLLGHAGLSTDGRWLAFVRSSRVRTPIDCNGATDVEVLDRVTGSNRLASLRFDGLGTGSDGSFEPSLTPDGRWLAFTSLATNLTSDAVGRGVSQIYLRDLVRGVTELVSRTSTGDGGDRPSSQPMVSAGGRKVAFTTASALVAADANNLRDIYVYDAATREVRLVSISVLGTGSANADSGNPRWSPDGSRLLFQSLASDLVANMPAGTKARWYGWDEASKRITHLGAATAQVVQGSLDDPAKGAVVNGDGTIAAVPDAIQPPSVIVRRLDDNAALKAVYGASEPKLDQHGSRLAFLVTGTVSDKDQIKVLDLPSGRTTIASVGPRGEPASAAVRAFAMSPDGRLVCFTTAATNLHPSAMNGQVHLYARDLVANVTWLLSLAPGGEPSTGVIAPLLSIGPSGTILFTTTASDLDPMDFNDAPDAYEVQVETSGEPPVLRITRIGTGEVTLIWTTKLGARYGVEWKADLDGPMWAPLDVPIVVQLGQATAIDTPDADQPRRFYRVVQR